MRIRRSPLFAGLLGLAVVASCTTVSHGTPRPAAPDEDGATSTPSTSGDEGEENLPFGGAPKVENPLDTSRYEQDPCQALTSEQSQDLDLPATGKIMDDVVLGAACEWKNETTRGSVQIFFALADSRGLSSEYGANDRGEWEYFKELPEIEGYPAVIRMGSDSRDLGDCTVVTGVADDMAFETIVGLSEVNVDAGKDPCAAAVDVAGMALQTMKKGA